MYEFEEIYKNCMESERGIPQTEEIGCMAMVYSQRAFIRNGYKVL